MKKLNHRVQKPKNRRKFPKMKINADGNVVDGVGYVYRPTKGWKRVSLRDNRFNLTTFAVNRLRRA